MDNINSCSICFEEFQNPKIISCFHTFCRDCLCAHVERVLKNGKFNRPVCRAVIENPKNGVDGFQSNFYITEVAKAAPPLSTHEESSYSLTDLKSEFCEKHEHEKLSLYCEDCKVPCCRDCKIESHDGHNSVKVIAKVKQLLKEAGELLTEIKVKTDQTQEQEMDLNTKLETVNNERTRIKDELINRKAILEGKIAQKADVALNTLTDLTKAVCNDITGSLRKIRTVEDELQEISTFLTETMETQDPIMLLQALSEIRGKLNRLEVKSRKTRISAARLFPGILVQMSDVTFDPQIQSTIGEIMLKKYPRKFKSFLENVTTIDTAMKTRSMYVKSILPVGDTEAWLAIRSKRESEKNTVMKKINANGNVLVSFQIKGLINSMTSFTNGTFAVTMPKENKICVVENEENVYELAGVRHPMGIASYRDELFVCSVESTYLKEIKPYSVNRVVVLSKEGGVKRTIEFFNGCPIFTFPGKISVTYSGDLIVSDFAKNKIVCIGPDGKPKHEYMGREEFFCGNVCCDNTGSILVDTSEGIHVLDENLKLVHRYATERPADLFGAMTVGQKGHIWTADESCRVTIWKYSTK